MTQDYILTKLLAENARWAEQVTNSDPKYFPTLARETQRPKVLWIGCADSRKSESILTGSNLGEIFVHRNIANQFNPEDDNALSVLAYAVESLRVEHIVIVGHTRCGGVDACAEAAANPPPNPLSTPLERWLAPLTEIAHGVPTEPSNRTPLVEANVRAQVANIVKTDVIQRAWAAVLEVENSEEEKRRVKVKIHGWVFELETGLLRDLGVTESAPKEE